MKTVLVIEDNEQNLYLTRFMLEQQGYRVMTASEGAEAIAMFHKHRDKVKLVLTDIMMPVMGGVNLIRSLHAIEPKLKVLAASGLTDQANQIELASVGVHSVLGKPCSPRQVLEAIRDQLAPAAGP